MSIWDAETTILRLMTVLFVFALLRIGKKGRQTGRETALYLTVVAASAAINLIRGGGGGFFLALSGAAVALALTAPLFARGGSLAGEAAAPAAAGSLLGPLGVLAAVPIALIIHMLQSSPFHRPVILEAFVFERGNAASPARLDDRSVIAMIESRRMKRGPGGGAGTDDDQRMPDLRGCCSPLHWKMSLAVATLAVLMTGMFV